MHKVTKKMQRFHSESKETVLFEYVVVIGVYSSNRKMSVAPVKPCRRVKLFHSLTPDGPLPLQFSVPPHSGAVYTVAVLPLFGQGLCCKKIFLSDGFQLICLTPLAPLCVLENEPTDSPGGLCDRSGFDCCVCCLTVL